MTLKSRIADDAKDVFLNTSEFAETVTYTPSGGIAQQIPAVVVREPAAADDGSTGLERHVFADLIITLEDIASPSTKDIINFDSKDWNIVSIVTPGDGTARLRAYRREPLEKSAQGHRIERG